MQLYANLYIIAIFQEDGGQEEKVVTNNVITHTKIENMKNILKSHRAALDFDRAFIVTSIKTYEDFDWKEELNLGEAKNGKRKRI
jgi:hypothetical protein